MTPYYQDSAVTIYHGDCREIVPTLGRFDLLLTDPPYGIGDTFIFTSTGAVSGRLTRKHKRMDWDDDIPEQAVFDMMNARSNRQVIWGANYFNCFSAKGGALVWHKNRGGKSLSQCEIASVSGQVKVDFVFVQVLSGFCAVEPNLHQTQKPLALMLFCVESYSEPNQTILDPFAGSGTTGRAAKDLGRKAVLIELEERYCEIAAQRMRQEVLPLEMVE